MAVDGVCLTVEELPEGRMVFTLAPESLRIMGYPAQDPFSPGAVFNLERSLRVGDRLHGHFVTGHVDARGRVQSLESTGHSRRLEMTVAHPLALLLWPKGSVAINGVSLTVNEVDERDQTGTAERGGLVTRFSVCLIPETLERTNLSKLGPGDAVNIEFDWMAKGLWRLGAGRALERMGKPSSEI